MGELIDASEIGKSVVGVQTLAGSAKSYNHFEFPVGLGASAGKEILNTLCGGDHSCKEFEKKMLNIDPPNGNSCPPENAQWAIVTAVLPTGQRSVTFMISGVKDSIKTDIVDALTALDSSATSASVTKLQTGKGHKSFGCSSGYRFNVHNDAYPPTVLLTSERFTDAQLKGVADALTGGLTSSVFDSSIFGTTIAPAICCVTEIRGSNGIPLPSDGYKDTVDATVTYKQDGKSFFNKIRVSKDGMTRFKIGAAFSAVITNMEGEPEVNMRDSAI